MAALLAVAAVLAAGPAPAQGLFSTVATVDGQAINRYQVDQRARFLALLRAPDADFDGARDVLIDEALQVQAARADGIELDPAELDEAMVEFAARVNLTPDRFVEVLEANGVAPETFRDFVRNGIFWRRLVQARFGERARPSDAEVDRTLAQGRGTSGARVLLSEIALPVTPETRADVAALADSLAADIAGADAFGQAARRFSRAPSAPRGGRLDWLPVVGAGAARWPSQVLTPRARARSADRIDLGVLHRRLPPARPRRRRGGAGADEGDRLRRVPPRRPDGRAPEDAALAARADRHLRRPLRRGAARPPTVWPARRSARGRAARRPAAGDGRRSTRTRRRR